MFSELSSSLTDLDDDARTQLASLLTKRIDYMEAMIQLTRLRVVALNDPSAEAEERVSDFSSAVTAPLRSGMQKEVGLLLTKSVNVDAAKEMLPMLLMALMQSVNLPLLMTTLGVEPDMIERMVGELSKYFKSGMSEE